MTITDNGDYMTIEYNGVDPKRDFIQKGSVNLKRDGDVFYIISAENVDDVKAKFNESEVTSPAHADADALQTALLAFFFA